MKTGSIEPLKLQGFKMVEKNGKKFIYAPLDETRIFYSDPEKEYKNGNKGTGRCYMSLVMFKTPNSEYSDYAVSESKEKDEDIELPIIGNFSNYVKTTEETKPEAEGDDDFPF